MNRVWKTLPRIHLSEIMQNVYFLRRWEVLTDMLMCRAPSQAHPEVLSIPELIWNGLQIFPACACDMRVLVQGTLTRVWVLQFAYFFFVTLRVHLCHGYHANELHYFTSYMMKSFTTSHPTWWSARRNVEWSEVQLLLEKISRYISLWS